MTIVLIIIAIIAVIALWVIFTYNKLVRMRMRVREAWADIDVQLKRRHNLIPNLVETVKGYVTHERETLESVTEARTKAIGAQTPDEHAQAENMLTGALKTLFAVSEQYPDLKANTNFLELQRELSDTENKIQASRRFYNTNVQEMNTAVHSFPINVIAQMFSFKPEAFFEVSDEEVRSTPKVSFTS